MLIGWACWTMEVLAVLGEGRGEWRQLCSCAVVCGGPALVCVATSPGDQIPKRSHPSAIRACRADPLIH
jgi:hypothetical protein